MSDLPSDTSTTAIVPVNGFTRGTLDSVADEDWFRVELKAGESYRIFWSAAGLRSAQGADFRLYDASGKLIYWPFASDATLDTKFGYTPAVTGTYFLGVGGKNIHNAPYAGDYSITVNHVTDSPLEAIDWGTRLKTTSIDVYFALPGEVYELAQEEYGTLKAEQWTDYAIQQEMAALAEFARFTNLTFKRTTDRAAAELTLILDEDWSFGDAFFNAPGWTDEGIGGVNGSKDVWFPIPGGAMEQGGGDWELFLHEFGHALGLAHPHDDGGASVVMRGIGDSDGDGRPDRFGDYGDFNLNQRVFTVVSENAGWSTSPHGRPRLENGAYDARYGWAGSPMALDILACSNRSTAPTCITEPGITSIHSLRRTSPVPSTVVSGTQGEPIPSKRAPRAPVARSI